MYAFLPVILPEDKLDTWLSGEARERNSGAVSGRSNHGLADQPAGEQPEE
jgi:hypothetical protein